jgi:thiamine-phosphate pyrophosphorylase
MTMQPIDYSLYLVTDRGLALGRPLEEIVMAAVNGGVTCVQLREKDCSSREFFDLALSLRFKLEKRRVPLIINDRLDIALAAGAAGVHLGQSDLPLEYARKVGRAGLVIGISANSTAAAVEAERRGADYIGLSPVFSTPTKTDTAEPMGFKGIEKIRKAVRIPLVGIGGLNAENAGEAIRHGADGIAVVSAIMSAPDPEEAAAKLLLRIREAKGK